MYIHGVWCHLLKPVVGIFFVVRAELSREANLGFSMINLYCIGHLYVSVNYCAVVDRMHDGCGFTCTYSVVVS